MFETLLTDRKNLSTSGNIPFTLCNHSFDITQGIFPQREANSILVGGMQEPLTPTGFPIQSAGLLPATFPASVTDSSLDPVTGEAMSGVYKALTAFATDPNFTDRMNVPFGESWDKEKAKALKEEWLRGNFSNIPLVKVVSSGDIAGANGAFGTATNTIYLSKEFLAQNATRLDALTGVLLEEVGHFIDSQVNHLDSPGDEGEIFAAVVQGKNLSQEKLQLLKAEDDRAMALIEGQEISIEQVANTVTVSATDASAAEVISGQTANPGVYRISRTGSTNSALAVPYTMSGTGSNGTDYTSLNGTATIPAGQTFVDVPLNVIDDTFIENNETAILTVSPSTNYTVGATNTAIVTIADNDPIAPPDYAGNTPTAARQVTVGSTSTTWSDWVGTEDTNDYYKFTLANSSNFNLSLNGLSSDADVHLLDSTGTTLLQSSTSGGTSAESISTVLNAGAYYVRVFPYSGSTNYNLSMSAVPNLSAVTVSAIDASAAEVISGQTANPGMYRITRTGGTTAPLTVAYTMSGTSLNGTDYTFLNGTATIAAGLTFVDVPLNVIDDTLIESNETAILTVSSSSNYTVGATNTATVTIADNDQNTVTVSAIDASAAEVVSGQTANGGTYRISRTGSTSSALAVPYTMSGTGSNGSDYTSLNGTATIAAGQTFVDVPLNVIDDTLIENTETAILTVSSSSNYTVGATNTATVTIADNDLADWFDLNIQDLGLRSTARVAASDNVINRNEMIGILRDAKDGNVIDSTELTNLRNLLTSNTRPFSIPHYVQNLTNKVVNSDDANQTYQGSYLGNLSANSSATQMEKLIGKWFLGNDHPVIPSNYTYQLASGSLFQNGVSYQDIYQGELGDCYFLAGLAVTANRTPQVISDMFIPNGDNTYTVRFYRNGSPEFVTVDKSLPTNSSGQLVYASMGSQYNSSTNELWVALAEKAYAQINESGWIIQNNTNSYESPPFAANDPYPGIVGGNPGVATTHVTGRNSSSGSITTIAHTNQILNTFNNGQLITFSSNIPSGAASPQVMQNHAYVLVDYNSSTQKFKLFNPWGMNGGSYFGIFKPGILELSSSEIVANFSSWDYTLPPGQSSVNSSNSPRPNVLGMSAFS